MDLNELVNIRKASPGADSYGHTWEHAGDVVAMPRWQAIELESIPGSDFTVAEATVREPAPGRAEITEPAPLSPQVITEAPADDHPAGKTPAKPRPRRKTD